MPHCELTNMCMISDQNGRVLVQHRLPKASNPWSGLTFPGGHVESGESITASVIREVREETGLDVSNLLFCGLVQWYNPVSDSQYIVFLFCTNSYTGLLHSSSEGKMEWMTLNDMRNGKLAPNMEKYLKVFLEDTIPQAFGISDGCLLLVDTNGRKLL